MLFAVYLDLDHGIGSAGPGRLLVFAGDHLLQFAHFDFKDPKHNLFIWKKNLFFKNAKSLFSVGGTGELIFQVKIVWVGIRLRDFLVLMKLYFLHDGALIKFN